MEYTLRGALSTAGCGLTLDFARDTLRRPLLLLFLFTLGLAQTFPIGFLGIMPLDQSILFESAGRVVLGEELFGDFVIPFGLVPTYLQAAFFGLFGIHWAAYVLHAAVLNGLFVVLVHGILDRYHPSWPVWNAGLAVLCGWLFGPTAGTPYAENHSFFFGVLSIFTLLLCERRSVFALVVLPSLACSVLSKQIPGILFVLPVACLLTFRRNSMDRRRWCWLGIGGAASAALICAYAFGRNAADYYYYYYELPATMGSSRFVENHLRLFDLAGLWNFFPKSLLAVILAIGARTATYWLRNRRISFPGSGAEPLALSLCLVLVCLEFALMTTNQFYNVYGVIFIALALSIPAVLSDGSARRTEIALALIFALAMLDLGAASTRILQRRFNDMEFNLEGRRYSRELGIYFQTPIADAVVMEDVEAVMQFLRDDGRPFAYFGDLGIVNSLLGNRSPFPSVFFHIGLSIPEPGTPRFERYNEKLWDNIRRIGTRSLVVERDQTWLGVGIGHFFQTEWLEALPTQRLGGYTVYSLPE